MSQVHRVIILNKPLKIRGFSIFQWVILGLAVALGFWLSATVVPQNWKIPGSQAPAGVLVFVVVVGLAAAFVNASEMKPRVWWVNQFYYRLKLLPLVFLPHPEPGQEYPDSSIIEPKKLEDQYYVQ